MKSKDKKLFIMYGRDFFMDRLLPLIKILPKDLLMDSNIDEKKFNELNEIRVRVGQPLRLIMLNREQRNKR